MVLLIQNPGIGGVLSQSEATCSGTLVADGWILTAGHCITTKKGFDASPGNISVILGRSDNGNKSAGVELKADMVVRHPAWSGTETKVTGIDLALVHVGVGFDRTRWHSIPIATSGSIADVNGGVTFFGYGNTRRVPGIGQVGSGRLFKSVDGVYSRNTVCDNQFGKCFVSSKSAYQIMHGDSGGPWVRWVAGAWQQIATESVGSRIAHGQGPTNIGNGEQLVNWVRRVAKIPTVSPGTILHEPTTRNAWLVAGDGYRNWIPTGGDYQCLVAQGHPVREINQILIDTVPDRVGVHATASCSSPPPPPTTWAEQQGSRGANTFTNYHNASGLGTKVAPGQWIAVSCKVYDPFIQTVNPDGYWYRIASSPWNNAYYAAANTFMNGDPWGGPYTHNTDFAVRNC